MSDKTPYLGNPQKTIEVIQKYEFAFQKNEKCLLYALQNL